MYLCLHSLIHKGIGAWNTCCSVSSVRVSVSWGGQRASWALRVVELARAREGRCPFVCRHLVKAHTRVRQLLVHVQLQLHTAWQRGCVASPANG